MSTPTDIPRNTSEESPWAVFAAANRDWLRSASWDTEDASASKWPQEEEQSQRERLVDYFLAVLSSSPERFFANGNDLQRMKNALTFIYEATEENILSESEANALVEFLASKFIERRFGVILQNLFDVENIGKYTFRGFRGKVEGNQIGPTASPHSFSFWS